MFHRIDRRATSGRGASAPQRDGRASVPPGAAIAVLAAVAGALAAPARGEEPIPGRADRARDRPALLAADFVSIQERLGSADAVEGSLDIVRKHAARFGTTREGTIEAFEETPLFLYALVSAPRRDPLRRARPGGADAREGPEPSDDEVRAPVAPGAEPEAGARRGGSPADARGFRRLFLLKPSTVVVEDVIVPRARGDASGRAAGRSPSWRLGTAGLARVEGRSFRANEGEVEILGETLLPEGATSEARARSAPDGTSLTQELWVPAPPGTGEVRFLHVIEVRKPTEKDAAARAVLAPGAGAGGPIELAVTTARGTFRLSLPREADRAGEIEVVDAGGTSVLPRRLLPSGILPHGPEGARLLERWDAPYRGDRTPGWDNRRPSSALVAAVEDGTLRPGRAIELGCGTGTNAIYLATRGFQVTAVDVAPSALATAREKARKAGVEVRWMLADVLALPELGSFDLIFDRGCYHHVRGYDVAGYAAAARSLSRPGTLLFILAGSDKQAGGGGPPRVKEEEIRGDFTALWDFVWLRDTRFDRPDADASGAAARSALLRRKDH